MMPQQHTIINKGNMPTQSTAIPIAQTKHNLNVCHSGDRCVKNGLGSLDIDREDDVLSPLPGDDVPLDGSPGALSRSPGRQGSLSPRTHRHRSHTMPVENTAPANFSRHTSIHLSHVPKDPIQPKEGSIQDIHSLVREGNEEDDVFSELPAMRRRSSTCPASMNRARRAKLRTLRRPATPPPMDLIEPHSHTSINTSIEKAFDALEKRVDFASTR